MKTCERARERQKDRVDTRVCATKESWWQVQSTRTGKRSHVCEADNTTAGSTGAVHERDLYYRGTSLIRNHEPLGSYSRTVPMVLKESYGGRRVLMSELPLHRGYSKVRTRTARRKVLIDLPQGSRTVCPYFRVTPVLPTQPLCVHPHRGCF